MELILLFAIVLFFSVLIFFFSKFTEERRFKGRLLIIGSFLLLSLWIGLFLETPEMEHGKWYALAVTASFLLGLSIFFLLFFQVFCEKFYSLPVIHFSYYVLQPIFLNAFCLINAALISLIQLNRELKILVTSTIAHLIIMFIYIPFYHKEYNRFEKTELQVQFKLYLFFAVVSLLYFAIGFMAIFVLSPLHISSR